MTHDELLTELDNRIELAHNLGGCHPEQHALRAVVELHKSNYGLCKGCTTSVVHIPYPCSTIQVIEKELG
jgi:hypothetical protein